MFTNMMIAIALFAMSAVNAKQIGGKGQPRVTTQQSVQQPIAPKQEAPKPSLISAPKVSPKEERVAGVAAEVGIDPTKWKEIQKRLRATVLPSKALESIAKVREVPLTEAQNEWLDQFEDNVKLRKDLQMQQGKVVPFMEKQKAQQEELKKTEGGLIGTTWDYESAFLSKVREYTPTTALGGAVTALGSAALVYFAAPAVLGYLSLGLAAKIGAGAVVTDRILYRYNTGEWTESNAVEALKTVFKNDLDDEGLYPTLYAQAEALLWEMEFSGIVDKNSRVVKLAFQDLRTDVTKKIRTLETNADQKIEAGRQKMISSIVDTLRRSFGFTEDNNYDYKLYAQNLENPKDFIMNNMTEANALAMIRAITSESLRMKTIVAIEEANIELQKQQKETPLMGLTEQMKKKPAEETATWMQALKNYFWSEKPKTSAGKFAQQVNLPTQAPQGKPSDILVGRE